MCKYAAGMLTWYSIDGSQRTKDANRSDGRQTETVRVDDILKGTATKDDKTSLRESGFFSDIRLNAVVRWLIA